jgi:hypothetical protein
VSTFTPGQRRVLLLLVVGAIVILAMLSGFVITTIQSLESATLTPLPTLTPLLPTPLSPTPLPGLTATPMTGIQSQVQAARLFDQIARQVETLRGLTPRAVVPLSFLDEREMAALVRQLYTERNPQARFLPYTTLGALPDTAFSVCVGRVAGLYVPEQQQVYVSTAQQENNPDDQVLLAYAYALALQDQHFDLRAMAARATTADAALAVQALAEGDAALLTAFYRYQDPATADWEHLVELLAEAEQPGCGEPLDSSAAWMRLQRFPYREGRQFVEALYQAGGWEAVNRAYADLPRSTEQILHPERYLGERDLPDPVLVPDLGAVLGAGWTPLLQDTLGEFATGLYLAGALPESTAWPAADGWDGDTLVVWERQDESRVLVWRSVWKSTAEAAEFERALAALVPQRYLPTWPVDQPPGLTGQWWETGAGAMAVVRVGRYVVLARAPDTDVLVRVVGALP